MNTLALAPTPETSIARASRIAPDIVAPGPWKQFARWLPFLAITAVLAFCFWDLNLDLSRLFSWSEVATRMLAGLLRPNPGGQLDEILAGLVETLAMGIAGTVLAVGLGLPLGVIGSKTVISNAAAHAIVRLVYDVMRGIPVLVWAIIIIRAIGLGPAAGVVALGFAESPYIAKLYAEILENTSQRPVAALRATGASGWQAIRFGLVPQVLPSFAGLALFFFEANVRAAAALGIVGAGGLGQLLEERIGYAAFDEAAFIIILLLVQVAIIDLLSSRLRQMIMGTEKISWI